MAKYNILVTGVGAIIGYGIINNLRKSKYDLNIIGMDIYDDAYGKNICDKFIQAIPACDKHYPEFIKQIIMENDIHLVMFGVEQELLRLAGEKEVLGDLYSKLVINKSDIIRLSQDKWETHKFLKEHNLHTIPTEISGSYEDLCQKLGTPFLLKPRSSYASKGIEKITSKEEFEFYKKRAGEQFMVQKIIGDNNHEYTSAVFGFGDGTCSNSITFKRKLSQEGATAKAQVVEIKEIDELIKTYCKILKPIGPTNFQFRYDSGKYYLLEINPRISSSTSIRQAFGYNEEQMCIEYFIENKKPEIKKLKKGYAIRYIADYVEYV